MVSKDQSIGGLIFAVCVIIGILYTIGLFYYGNPLGSSGWSIEFWLVALPVFIAFVAIMAIGAWIGWTMATTPPPKPIEEITTEIEEEKKEAKEEGQQAPAETPTTPAGEPEPEKKPERKKRTEKTP